ncbi:putative oligomeric golgi complex component 8 [Leishmania mexicana MHOM/GT/2001/U1103]|uniref:Conserved oligomeric Golgi complex subunit 8 n=1 Tax=Leishmania mexicana (strain MHOM/GT/2001/U1103) TaxID=929439 RepID=E9B0B2_LEIMU|nr:putative oligomeric golgi complex component 8 [Leishmania mexicana MHOM/GT/2001/U1103]CBZ28664.1 putative oligomeric golgi complex component 8 [Leishmania mexicana MHOM/GT/2001/U1103]
MTTSSAAEARVRQSIVNCAVDHYELLTNAQAANMAAASLSSTAEDTAKELTASLQTLHSWSQLLQYAGQSWRQEKAQLHGAVMSHQKIVALMESPALVEECVRQTMFHEALLIFDHVMMLCQHMSDVYVFQRLQKEVVDTMEQAVNAHVLPMLSGVLTVDTAYKAISLLRRLGGSPASLRALFLRSRAAYIRQLLQEAESSVVPYSLILKYITVYKMHVNEVTLQYKACFPSSTEAQQRQATEELSLWCQEQAHMFIHLMAAALQHLHNGSELALVVQQCSSCASASARVHTDVLGLLGNVLVQKVHGLFADGMRQARTTYRTAMKTSSWRVSVYCHNNSTLTSSTVIKAPPTISDTPAVQLAQWLPLAYALNGMLSSFNTIRKCLLPGVEAPCEEEVRQLVCEVGQDMLNDAPLLDTMYSAERAVFVTFVKAFQRLWYPYVLHLVERLLGPAHREDLEDRTQALMHGIGELLFAVEPPSTVPAAESVSSLAPPPAHPHASTTLVPPIPDLTTAPVAAPSVPPATTASAPT